MTAVTVIMACFNGAAHLPRSVASLQAQRMADWELLIVDDASSDGSWDAITALAGQDPRIRGHRMPQNGGPSAARNAALALAKGKWVTILDADDAFQPDRLEQLLALAEERDLDLLFDNLLLFDEADRAVVGSAHQQAQAIQALDLARMIDSERPHSPFKYGFLKMFARRAFLEAHGLRYSEEFRLAEDFMLYVEMLLKGAKAATLQDAYYLYTTQTGQRSGVRATGTRTVFKAEQRITLGDRLIERHGADARHRALLCRYREWQRLYAHAHHMARLREERRNGELLRTAVAQPRAALYYFSRTKIGRRIGLARG